MDTKKTDPGATSARSGANSQDSGMQHDVGAAASGLRGSLQGLAEARAEKGMQMAAERLESAARATDKTGSSLRGEQPQIASFADEAASKMHQAADYFEHHDTRDLVSEANRFARREPMLVIAGGLILGFAAARVLRVSAEDGGSQDSSSTRTPMTPQTSTGRAPASSTRPASAGMPTMRDAPVGRTASRT